MAAAFLGDDALEAELEDLLPERFAVQVGWASSTSNRLPRLGLRAAGGAPSMGGASLASVDRKHVEHDQHHVDAPLAVEHPIAQPGEARQAVIAEADELAVHCEAVRQRREFGDEAGHVPAAATPDAQVPFRDTSARNPSHLGSKA